MESCEATPTLPHSWRGRCRCRRVLTNLNFLEEAFRVDRQFRHYLRPVLQDIDKVVLPDGQQLCGRRGSGRLTVNNKNDLPRSMPKNCVDFG